MASNLSDEQRRELTNARQNAVRNAWKNEKELVLNGRGTRNWSEKEQLEIAKRGSVKGYEGHHMKSVSRYPSYAGNPSNIQFLSDKEHLDAHGGDYHSPTNGYYNPKTKKMENFSGRELKPVQDKRLSSPAFSDGKRNTHTNSQSKFSCQMRKTNKRSV